MVVLVGYGVNVFGNGQNVGGKIAKLVGHGPRQRHEIESHRIAAEHMQTDSLTFLRLVTYNIVCAAALKTGYIKSFTCCSIECAESASVQSHLYRCVSSRCNICHYASRQSLFGGFEGKNERVARLHLARVEQVSATMMPTETVHFVQVVIVICRRIE